LGKASGEQFVSFGTLISVNPVQSLNALLPISFTLLGMVISVNPVQPENASSPISFTLLGMVITVNPVQSENPLSSVTLSGMVTFVNPVQPEKAHQPIFVTLGNHPRSIHTVCYYMGDMVFPSSHLERSMLDFRKGTELYLCGRKEIAFVLY
jgi:hypothetical protein